MMLNTCFSQSSTIAKLETSLTNSMAIRFVSRDRSPRTSIRNVHSGQLVSVDLIIDQELSLE